LYQANRLSSLRFEPFQPPCEPEIIDLGSTCDPHPTGRTERESPLRLPGRSRPRPTHPLARGWTTRDLAAHTGGPGSTAGPLRLARSFLRWPAIPKGPAVRTRHQELVAQLITLIRQPSVVLPRRPSARPTGRPNGRNSSSFRDAPAGGCRAGNHVSSTGSDEDPLWPVAKLMGKLRLRKISAQNHYQRQWVHRPLITGSGKGSGADHDRRRGGNHVVSQWPSEGRSGGHRRAGGPGRAATRAHSASEAGVAALSTAPTSTSSTWSVSVGSSSWTAA